MFVIGREYSRKEISESLEYVCDLNGNTEIYRLGNDRFVFMTVQSSDRIPVMLLKITYKFEFHDAENRISLEGKHALDGDD